MTRGSTFSLDTFIANKHICDLARECNAMRVICPDCVERTCAFCVFAQVFQQIFVRKLLAVKECERNPLGKAQPLKGLRDPSKSSAAWSRPRGDMPVEQAL